MVAVLPMSARTNPSSLRTGIDVTQRRVPSVARTPTVPNVPTVPTVADDPQSWIATSRLRSEASTLAVVQGSLGATQTRVETGLSGVASSQDLLARLREELVKARDGKADLAGLADRLQTLQTALRTNALQASEAELELLAADRTAPGYADMHAYLAAISTDATGLADILSMNVDTRLTQLFDWGVTRAGILQRLFALPLSVPTETTFTVAGLSGTAASTSGLAEQRPDLGSSLGPVSTKDGMDANAPGTAGLSGTADASDGADARSTPTDGLSGRAATVSGQAQVAARQARAAVGSFNAGSPGLRSGDTIELTTRLDGEAARTVRVRLRSVGDASTLQSELNRALEAEYGANRLRAEVASDGSIRIEKATAGAGSVEVSGVQVVDGDDVTTSKLTLIPQIRDEWYDWVNVGSPNLTGIDRSDRLRFTYRARDWVGREYTNDVTVSLEGINNGGDLVKAINDAIAADRRQGQNWSNAIQALWSDGYVIFQKGRRADAIKVTGIEAINGNGVVAQNVGLATGSGTGVAGVAARAASATSGSSFDNPVTLKDGATIGFDLTLNDRTTSITLTRSSVDAALGGDSGYVMGSGTIRDASALARVAERALRDKSISNVSVQADANNRLVFTKTDTPADGDRVDVTNVTSTASAAKPASLLTGSDFTSPITIASNASISFDLQIDGNSRTLKLTKSDVESALTGRPGYTSGSGTIADAEALALTVGKALEREGISGLTVAAEGARLRFTRTAAGSGTLGLSAVNASAEAVQARASFDMTGPITVPGTSPLDWSFKLNGAERSVRITSQTVDAALSGTPNYTAGSGRIADAASLALVLRRALSEAGITDLSAEAAGSRVSIISQAAGAGSVSLASPVAHATPARSASLVTGSDFSGNLTLGDHSTLGFEIGSDQGAPQRIQITKADVDAALGGTAGYVQGTGTIADTAALAKVVEHALGAAGLNGIAVASEGARLVLTKTQAGVGSLSLGGIDLTAPEAALINLSVPTLDVAAEDLAARPVLEQNLLLNIMIQGINQRIADVAKAEAYLTFVNRHVSMQRSFLAQMDSIMSEEVGRLVKADLDAETARQEALLVSRDLADQALRIADRSRLALLSLFPDNQNGSELQDSWIDAASQERPQFLFSGRYGEQEPEVSSLDR